ncbi:MAG: glyoxalase [Gammaproteobacteria bacterium]|nr:glyoxalase [Gammaproteobacteria bacterium]
MFHISQFHHASLIVNDTEVSLRFYRDLLGLAQEMERPDLGYPGAWLNIGDQQIHLLELPNPDPVENRPQHGGRDRHLAFRIDGLSGLVETLERGNIDFTISKSGRKALFCRDPDGNALEFIEG